MSIEGSFEQEARENLKTDGKITQAERKLIRDAIKKDANEVIQTSKSGHRELSAFMREEYWFLSKQNVGIEGIKRFQKSQGLPADGKYGNRTFEAVVQYQITNKIRPADGIITQNILAGLLGESTRGNTDTGRERFSFDEAASVSYLQENYSEKDIKNIKKLLKLNKGASLNQVVEKIAQFQKVEGGLTIDGILGPKTLAALQASQERGYSTPMTNEDIARMNEGVTASEQLRNIEVPRKWKVIFQEFFLHAKGNKEKNEILSGKYPIALTDTRTGKGLIIMGKESMEFPVSYSKNGKFVKGPTQGDNAVNYGFIEHFTIGTDYRYGGKKIQVREQEEGHGTGSLKRWHAAAGGGQNGLRNTIGCKGLPPNVAATLANYVNRAGKGFGYASRT